MGLRNCVIYNDTYSYVMNFRTLENMSAESIFMRWPKDTFFYLATSRIHPFIFHNYTVWLLIISAIYIIPLSLIVRRYSVNPMLSWICFVFLGMMMFTMAGLRQTVAMGLTMLSFIALIDRKQILFVALLLSAALFHGTALIFVIVYPLVRYKIKFSQKAFIIYVFATIVFMIAGQTVLRYIVDVVSENDERYIGYAQNMFGSTFTYFFQQLLLVVPALYYLKAKFDDPKIAIFAHLSMIALMFVSLSPTIAEMFRVSMYFSWANMILFPLAMKEAAKHGSIVQTAVIAFVIVYLIFINKTLQNPYYFWFEDASHLLQWY
ncbi:MAG: EpsG family protein [Muribaculum sp.]|nr:EpsG family protein [Muribaculum sp.]